MESIANPELDKALEWVLAEMDWSHSTTVPFVKKVAQYCQEGMQAYPALHKALIETIQERKEREAIEEKAIEREDIAKNLEIRKEMKEQHGYSRYYYIQDDKIYQHGYRLKRGNRRDYGPFEYQHERKRLLNESKTATKDIFEPAADRLEQIMLEEGLISKEDAHFYNSQMELL